MANIPYYGLSQGGMGQANLNQIEDPYQGLREGISSLQKFVEQKETVETSKLLAEARSNWNIRLNELQKEKGLDAEGFSSLVEQEMADYENNIMSRVPFSQREKFSAEFAGLKYDMLTKSSIYETDALSKKMVNDVSETIEFNANTILSDPTQRQRVIDDTDDLIDDLDIAESAKEELKNGAREKFAISEINALTERNADLLLHNLNSGVYDKDITSKQKAAALGQAQRKIEKNKNEAERNKLAELNSTFTNDYLFIVTGNVDTIDINDITSKPIYRYDPDKIVDLRTAYFKRLDDEHNALQTAIKLEAGKLLNPNKAQKKSIDYVYDEAIKKIPDFKDRLNKADVFIKLTNGYAPNSFIGEIYNLSNSPDGNKRKIAYNVFYDLKRKYPQLESSLSDEKAAEFYIRGAALNAGMSLPDIEQKISSAVDKNVMDTRDSKLKKILKDKKFDLDADSEQAELEAINIFSSAYKLIGDEKTAKDIAENTVNSSYGDTAIGVDSSYWRKAIDVVMGVSAGRASPDTKSMYMPPEKVYGRSGDSFVSTVMWQRKDLEMDLEEQHPDVKYDDIMLGDTLAYDDEGNIIYLITNKKGVPLMYWRPDYMKYQEKIRLRKNEAEETRGKKQVEAEKQTEAEAKKIEAEKQTEAEK